MKVYIVTEGCYSDYHIEAVFLDKQKAESYIVGWDGYHIEEFETADDTVKDIGDVLYKYVFEKYRSRRGEFSLRDKMIIWKDDYMKDVAKNLEKGTYYAGMCVYLDEDNEEKACKIVNDRWAKKLAEERGV